MSMESPDKRFSELVDIAKCWIPWRSEAATVSRDFWMPDKSCRVCYDCDSQFTIINRRHHCRLCGRVFCAKCTSNSVPVSPRDQKNVREEGERMRVCNYCFKQRDQEITSIDNGLRAPSPILSPSPSTASLASSKSSGTCSSTYTTAASVPYSTREYQCASFGSGSSPRQSTQMEPCPEKQGMLIPVRNMDSVVDIGDTSPNQFGYCMNRSDDEDDEYGACRSDLETHFQMSNDYYGPVEFGEVDQGYRCDKMRPAEENIDAKEVCSPACHNTEFHASLGTDKMAEESGPDNSYECDASSSIYGMGGSDAEPVDFENNGLLWLPPDPEDEDDVREAVLFDDDDDEDATGEWGYMRSSNSFGSGEYRCRDRSSEEHRKAMKNVVDGHFRALIAQLLQVENLPMAEEDDKESWFDIVTALSWEAANFLRPDTSEGGGMDPGGYVKIKCIACGHRSESMVVRGVVCKKNVAHRRMTSKIEKPRFLILGGALEYQRVTNQLSSVDTLLQQEMDHLKMAVAKIDAHHPNVLLVEKSVSRFAQEYLLAKNISLVLNLKRPLLERIARCTGAQMVPSIDHLSSQKLGFCDLFHVEKFYEEHGSAGQGGKKMTKTLMFFEECPKPLGCTVLLKGANGDELKKVKHVVQYGVFAAYHLALETSFLADEGASLPELPLKSPITVALPDKPSNIDRSSISRVPGYTLPATSKPQLTSDVQKPPNMPGSTLTSGNYRKLAVTVPPYSIKNHISQISEPVSTFASPAGDMSALPVLRKEENTVGFLEDPKDISLRTDDQRNFNIPGIPAHCVESLGSINREGIMENENQIQSRQMTEVQSRSSDLGISHQNDNQKDENTPSKEDFPPSPSDHQSILVSLSSRCVRKGTVCKRPHLFRIKYYGNWDKPLGRFLRDHLFDQNYRCQSCEMPSEAHVHCYTHRQGSLTISVRKLSDNLLSGERDGKIWMWHRCLRCPRINGFPPATRRVVMSDAAWGLSFGKFLELSFSNHAAASRVASCGHSLHRDCLRFYGFGKMVACFRYASISLHSVYLPPPKLDFNYQHQEWVYKEAKEVADNSDRLFSEVLNALCQIEEKKPNTGSLDSDAKILESRRNILELEGMLQKEKAEFENSLLKVVKRDAKKGGPVIDALEVNKLRRQLLFQAYLWDQRLIFAARLENCTDEVLAGFMARNKEKLMSNEKALRRNFISSDSSLSDYKSDEPYKGCIYPVDYQEGLFDLPNQLNVGEKRRVEQDPLGTKQFKPSLLTSKSTSDQFDSPKSGFAVRRVLSDGQFQVVADLSDTFDAKWTGENGPGLAELSLPNSSTSVLAAAAVSVPEDSEERSGADDSQFSLSRSATRCGDSAEDFSRWIGIPFQNFYRSINKNWGNMPRFNNLSDYNPVYISLFREAERQGGARLLLPLGVNDTVIPVYDDEPTSIIAYALVSPDYHSQISDDREKLGDSGISSVSLTTYDSGNSHPFHSADEISLDSSRSFGSIDDNNLSLKVSRNSIVLDPLSYAKNMHVRVSFSDDGPSGKVKYNVVCYYGKCFDSLRKTCCSSEFDFIRSLSRCKTWGAQGGKSNAFFAKSLDDRFIIKEVSKTELESFIKFAPEYFKYVSESISTQSPSCLAKILGIYQVTTKHLKGGKEMRMDVLVMENLLFGRNVTRLYDLKGSLRSRYNSDSSGNNKVLLDENLIESMPTSPIFVGNKAKRLLERAVWNDTAFLASIDVMDYSLLVGVDEKKHVLVLGIIDFMRQYTWDKHLETWVKASGILGGPKNVAPTVISPKQYKKRFRKAMSTYFLVVPDQWSFPAIPSPIKPQPDIHQDNQQNEDSLES